MKMSIATLRTIVISSSFYFVPIIVFVHAHTNIYVYTNLRSFQHFEPLILKTFHSISNGNYEFIIHIFTKHLTLHVP